MDRVDQPGGRGGIKTTFDWFESLESVDFGDQDLHTKEEVEAWFKQALQNNEAEVGLYDIGLSKLLVDRIDEETVLCWFESIENFEVALEEWGSVSC